MTRHGLALILALSVVVVVDAQVPLSNAIALPDGQFAIVQCEEARGSSVLIRMITVADRNLAETLLTRLRKGEQFSVLAREFSSHSTRDVGGAIPEIDRGDLSSELQAALKKMAPCPTASSPAARRARAARAASQVTITGTLVGESDGAAVSGARVSVFGYDGVQDGKMKVRLYFQAGKLLEARSDLTGSFAIPDLTVGQYLLLVSFPPVGQSETYFEPGTRIPMSGPRETTRTYDSVKDGEMNVRFLFEAGKLREARAGSVLLQPTQYALRVLRAPYLPGGGSEFVHLESGDLKGPIIVDAKSGPAANIGKIAVR